MLHLLCSRRDWMGRENLLISHKWIWDSIMSLLLQITVDLVMGEIHLMRTDVAIRVRMFGMPIKRMDGQSMSTLASNSVSGNSTVYLEHAVDSSYKENLLSQSHEGCNLAGFIRVNKVVGNFHVAPGRSFAINGMHVHDTVYSHFSPVNNRGNISINKTALENIIQAILSMTSVSALTSTRKNSKGQKNGAILSKILKNIQMMVYFLFTAANISKFQLPLLPQMRFYNVQLPFLQSRTNTYTSVLNDIAFATSLWWAGS
jgi:hypothetical protein